MYDLDDDERISREELLAVLHMMVGENIRWGLGGGLESIWEGAVVVEEENIY